MLIIPKIMAYFDVFGLGDCRMPVNDQVHEETSENGTKKKKGRIGKRKVDLGSPKDETEVPS